MKCSLFVYVFVFDDVICSGTHQFASCLFTFVHKEKAGKQQILSITVRNPQKDDLPMQTGTLNLAMQDAPFSHIPDRESRDCLFSCVGYVWKQLAVYQESEEAAVSGISVIPCRKERGKSLHQDLLRW